MYIDEDNRGWYGECGGCGKHTGHYEDVLGLLAFCNGVAPSGETSDGYHTFDELYEHRTALFAALCRSMPGVSWKSKKHHDGTMFDGMFVAGMDTPAGMITYHIENEYWRWFNGVVELRRAPEFDGHTPDDVVLRLKSVTYMEP